MKPLIGLTLSLLLALLSAACAPRQSTPAPTMPTLLRVTLAPPTATPFIVPTPPPSPPPTCPGTLRERLIPGERGRVLADDPRPVNLRAEPGTAAQVRAQIPVEAIFFVLEGPACAGEYAWFRVRYRETEGWLAEGDLTSYYVEPYPPG